MDSVWHLFNFLFGSVGAAWTASVSDAWYFCRATIKFVQWIQCSGLPPTWHCFFLWLFRSTSLALCYSLPMPLSLRVQMHAWNVGTHALCSLGISKCLTGNANADPYWWLAASESIKNEEKVNTEKGPKTFRIGSRIFLFRIYAVFWSISVTLCRLSQRLPNNASKRVFNILDRTIGSNGERERKSIRIRFIACLET